MDPTVPQQPAPLAEQTAAQQAVAQPQPESPTIQQSSSGDANAGMTPLFSPPGPLYRGVDAAYPGSALPPGTRILGAYIGIPGQGNASPDTPHIWSTPEWNHYVTPNPDLRLLPFYVHNYVDGQPEADAANAVAAAAELGWSPGLKGEAERLIVIDAETLVDYDYFRRMGEAMQRAGFRPAMYGSASTVRGNPKFGGYILADWNGRHAPTALSPGVLGVQWKPGPPWDLAVYSKDLYFGCGHGLRRGA